LAVHHQQRLTPSAELFSGLSGTVVLQNNGGDSLTESANGAFVFATPVNDGSAYAVTVLTSQPEQVCSVGSGTGTYSGFVARGSGTVSGSNITNIPVTCSNGSSKNLHHRRNYFRTFGYRLSFRIMAATI